MTPERVARLVAWWVRWYTREVPAPVARRRTDEIDADLHDHIAHDRAQGLGDRRIALSILSRLVRGVDADASWRSRHALERHRTAYRLAAGVALLSVLFLFWVVGAVGVIGETGDRADMMYLAVLAIGVVGTLLARFRPRGMARVLLTMALAHAVIAVIALVAGKHESPITSVGELLGLNAMFAAGFVASAWLFRFAAPGRSSAPPD